MQLTAAPADRHLIDVATPIEPVLYKITAAQIDCIPLKSLPREARGQLVSEKQLQSLSIY